MITILKTTQLTPGQLDHLAALCHQSQKQDGFDTHFYWPSLKQRSGDFFSDFLLYLDQKLVACVSLFLFEEDGVEICALTHPEHRKKGYFYRLLSEAQMEIFGMGLKYCTFGCPKESNQAKKMLKKAGALYQSSEIELQISRKTYSPSPSEAASKISIKKAGIDDAISLARLGSACFRTSQNTELERMQAILQQKNRLTFMALHEKNIIGKIHGLRHTPDLLTLHDFCLLPQFQSQGLAPVFLNKVISHFFKYSTQAIKIQCASGEPHILKLYKKIGFQETATTEFWRLSLMPDPDDLEDFHTSLPTSPRPILH